MELYITLDNHLTLMFVGASRYWAIHIVLILILLLVKCSRISMFHFFPAQVAEGWLLESLQGTPCYLGHTQSHIQGTIYNMETHILSDRGIFPWGGLFPLRNVWVCTYSWKLIILCDGSWFSVQFAEGLVNLSIQQSLAMHWQTSPRITVIIAMSKASPTAGFRGVWGRL